MHTEYLQSVRYKLQKRIRRQKNTKWETYPSVLQQLLQFLDAEPSLIALQAELAVRCPNADSVASAIIKNGLEMAAREKLVDAPLANETEWAAVSMGVLRRFSELDDSRACRKFVVQQSSNAFNDYLAAFSDFYLIPFYEYLDERLDDPQFVLGRLIRFKHLSEWFWRDDLLKLSQDESRHGEKRMTERLYEFLYTEGIEIHIEPSSASGEADMVSSQEGPDRLVAESKIFNPDKSKSKAYILQGFRQIYQYTLDYNSAMGYLVIFNTSNKQLRFAVSGGAAPLPHVVLNHKAIFFVVIDLYPHEETASKRPQQDFVQITEDEILGVAQALIPDAIEKTDEK
jgi:ribosomal protein L21E